MKMKKFMMPAVEEFRMPTLKLKRVTVIVFAVFGNGPELGKHFISLDHKREFGFL